MYGGMILASSIHSSDTSCAYLRWDVSVSRSVPVEQVRLQHRKYMLGRIKIYQASQDETRQPSQITTGWDLVQMTDNRFFFNKKVNFFYILAIQCKKSLKQTTLEGMVEAKHTRGRSLLFPFQMDWHLWIDGQNCWVQGQPLDKEIGEPLQSTPVMGKALDDDFGHWKCINFFLL